MSHMVNGMEEDMFRSPEEKGSREWRLARGYWDETEDGDERLVRIPKKKPKAEPQPGYIETDPYPKYPNPGTAR